MGKRVQDDICKFAFVGQPLEVLDRLAQDRSSAVLCGVGGFGMDEDNHGIWNILIDFVFGNVGQGFRMALPAKMFGLETEQLHRAPVNKNPESS
jgi:hypothetical protein